MFGLFKLFQKKCNHCSSTNLTKTKERETGYSVPVIRTIFRCNCCGAESVKTKVYRRGESVLDEHKGL